MTWLLGAALLGALHLLLAVAALAGAAGWFVFLVVVLAAGEAFLKPRAPRLHRALEAMQVGRSSRLVLRGFLLVLLVLAVGSGPRWLPGATVVAVAVWWAGQLIVQRESRELRRRTTWPLGWQRIQVPALELPEQQGVGSRLRATGPEVVAALDVPAAVAVTIALGGGWSGWFVMAVVLVFAVVVAVAAALRMQRRSLPARDRDEVVLTVRSALERLAPRIVIYFGGPPSSTHALNVWLEALEALPVPVLVMVRQRVHMEQMSSQRLPVVWAPRATDVEGLVVPSIELALYPTNIVQNNHLIRLPGVTDVFVGHGDSDKGGSSTPLSRIYDEVWVAGPAGRDRYRTADVGVRDEQVREIGRPQLAEIAQLGVGSTRADGGQFTVLYAPTWEGFYSSWSYSSLLHMGERIVSGLLALDGVRVLVKPHPASGSVDKRYGRAARRVVSAVRAAGGPHRVVDGVTGLYEAFNEADLLVTDVSSVVTDFLWSRKPYVMTNPNGLPPDVYRQEFPSSAGAAIWGKDLSALGADVQEARTADSRRADREAVSRYLLGEDQGHATAGFVAAVQDVLRDDPSRTPGHASPVGSGRRPASLG